MARLAPKLRPLKEDVTGAIGGTLWIVMGTIGMVLLIACANVANLLLVRADGRQQELAIRSALGAGWKSIAAELIAESVTLGALGAVAGLLCRPWRIANLQAIPRVFQFLATMRDARSS